MRTWMTLLIALLCLVVPCACSGENEESTLDETRTRGKEQLRRWEERVRHLESAAGKAAEANRRAERALGAATQSREDLERENERLREEFNRLLDDAARQEHPEVTVAQLVGRYVADVPRLQVVAAEVHVAGVRVLDAQRGTKTSREDLDRGIAAARDSARGEALDWKLTLTPTTFLLTTPHHPMKWAGTWTLEQSRIVLVATTADGRPVREAYPLELQGELTVKEGGLSGLKAFGAATISDGLVFRPAGAPKKAPPPRALIGGWHTSPAGAGWLLALSKAGTFRGQRRDGLGDSMTGRWHVEDGLVVLVVTHWSGMEVGTHRRSYEYHRGVLRRGSWVLHPVRSDESEDD